MIGSFVSLFSLRGHEVVETAVVEKDCAFEKRVRQLVAIIKREDWRLARPLTQEESLAMARQAIWSDDPRRAIQGYLNSLGIKDKNA